jgi:uncharacterized protein (DUF111 family)
VWVGTVAGGQGSGVDPQRTAFNIQHSTFSIPPTPVLLETNIDDQPAEQLAYAVEQLIALGALDAWLAPIVMKKGRPATLLSALVPHELEDAAVALILRETTTLGVRRRPAERHVAEREVVTVTTPWGDVRVKLKRWQGQELGGAPEYEDCARLAREQHVPLREIYLAALRALTLKS